MMKEETSGTTHLLIQPQGKYQYHLKVIPGLFHGRILQMFLYQYPMALNLQSPAERSYLGLEEKPHWFYSYADMKPNPCVLQLKIQSNFHKQHIHACLAYYSF